MTIKRILVPTDFSEGSAAALRYAMELASHFPATVRVLHIVEPRSADGQQTTVAKPKEMPRLSAARRQLRNAIPRIAGVRFGIDRDVRMGATVDQIVQCAREELADLIVMRCSHAATGTLRSECTVEQVAKRAPCPVVTLPIVSDAERRR
jgi:nucleotide-binding universal stress UspA family protein